MVEMVSSEATQMGAEKVSCSEATQAGTEFPVSSHGPCPVAMGLGKKSLSIFLPLREAAEVKATRLALEIAA